MLADANFRESLRLQHNEFAAALEKTTKDIQQRLWEDMERIRMDYERLIHHELRLIRQRTHSAIAEPVAPAPKADFTEFDYTRFAERFRGSEEYVREGQRYYLP